MRFNHLLLTLIVSLFVTNNLNAQIKVMAAPGNMKMAASNVFPKSNNVPIADSTNIYNEMLNDETDDLMENHPAGDIYGDIWTSDRLNPYRVPISSLPDSIVIDCSDFVMPVSVGRISSKFGPRRYRYHYGIDIALPSGNKVVSSFSGKVRIIDYEPGGYGKYVVVRHDNGLETVYAHLSAVTCKLDQRVKAGQELGLSGNTGRSTGPHLHFETRYVGNAFNPATIINFDSKVAYADNYTLTKRKNFGYQQVKAKTSQLAKYYRVRKGDNLSRIAARNGTTVSKLRSLNGLKSSSTIRAGQRLRIR
ncbi:MAG: peptidoglycan DD-metalloendopeptidase family protein [Porphyromonadaceae bacterium]|jgi:murein DD-endopeptidase MepM/ murein hydrolase activator NlpD|nr:peptidoglycan DD-metalloendopeptidase family protein [Porphyromonadaceae bacterium]